MGRSFPVSIFCAPADGIYAAEKLILATPFILECRTVETGLRGDGASVTTGFKEMAGIAEATPCSRAWDIMNLGM